MVKILQKMSHFIISFRFSCSELRYQYVCRHHFLLPRTVVEERLCSLRLEILQWNPIILFIFFKNSIFSWLGLSKLCSSETSHPEKMTASVISAKPPQKTTYVFVEMTKPCSGCSDCCPSGLRDYRATKSTEGRGQDGLVNKTSDFKMGDVYLSQIVFRA